MDKELLEHESGALLGREHTCDANELPNHLKTYKVMAIDGELADEEKKLCARVSANMDFSGPEFDRILVDVIEKGRLGEM